MAQTNVQAFSGDVAISSNLAVDTNTLFVDSVGNKVGIGTTVPTLAKLDVSVNDTSSVQIAMKNLDQNGRTGLSIINAAGQSFAIQHIGGPSMSSNTAIIENFSQLNGGIEFYNKGDGAYKFHTTDSNQERVRITNDGNVGIGKTNPGSALDVVGDVAISSNLAVDTNTLFVDSVGNKVGIGTTNPRRLLDVSDSTGETAMHISGLAGQSNVFIYMTETSARNYGAILHYSGTGTPQGFRVGHLQNSTTPRYDFAIDRTSGNVGIGVANPQQKLEVHGNILLGQNDIDSFIHGGSSLAMCSDHDVLIVSDANDLSDAAGADIIFGSGSAIDMNLNRNFTFAQAYPSGVPRLEHMRITGSGKVGIGTNVPSSKLTVNEIPNNRNTYDHSLAPMTVTNRTATSNTTLNDPKDVLNLAREGTSGEAFGARATFKLSRYENSYANSRTQLDLNLAHGTYDDQNIMTMRSNGKVGIGTDAPGFMLDVNGTLRASGESRLGLGFGRINGITCNMNSSTTNLNYRDIGIVNGGATKFFIRAVKNGDHTYGNATFDVLINKGRFGPSNATLFNQGEYGRYDGTYGTWPDIQYQFLNSGSHSTSTLRLNLYNANADTNNVPFTVTITCIGDVQGTIIEKTFVDEY